MAGASDKKQAVSNTKILKEIHLISSIINALTVLVLFIFSRPSSKKWYIIMNIPSFICEYILEKSGRAKYQLNPQGYQVLVKPGEDLQQSGLTEYMFDIVYLTLFLNILMVLLGTNKVWLLFLIVPAFALFKMKNILSMVLGMVRGPSKSGQPGAGETQQTGGEPVKSKRQAKLEARGNKQKVRYR